MTKKTLICIGALVVSAAGPRLFGQEWELLGQRLVQFRTDRDTIPVTAGEGTFRKLKLEVRRNGVHILDLKVHFGNGEVHDVSIRRFIKAGGQTRVIDLPGRARVIRRVALTYQTGGKRKGHALVKLLGK